MKTYKFILRWLFVFIIVSPLILYSQNPEKNKYGLSVINSLNEYNKLIEEDSSKKLINLENLIQDIKLDIRYATYNNFLGKSVYDTAMAFLRLPAAYALLEVQNELRRMI